MAVLCRQNKKEFDEGVKLCNLGLIEVLKKNKKGNDFF